VILPCSLCFRCVKTGITWKSLFSNVQKKLQDSIRLKHGSFEVQSLSNVIYSFGKIGARWDQLIVTNILLSELKRLSPHMIPQAVSNVIYG
jgi:hypothetical protein